MKKFLCLLLSLLLVLPLAAACGEDTPDPVNTGDNVSDTSPSAPDTDDSTDTGTDTEPIADTEPARAHKVPVDNLDFGNESFHVVGFGNGPHKTYFFWEGEESSDPMQTAIYERQIAVEEAIGVKLEHTRFEPNYIAMVQAVNNSVGVGDDDYQCVLMHQIDSIASFVTSGTLYPIDMLPHVDLNADWWDAEQMELLRLGQSTYYGINDYLMPSPAVLLFNKEIAATIEGMPDFYQLVKDYKWTLDALESAARLYSRDVNNDGVWDSSDNYGIGNPPTTGLWTSCNQPITAKDEDGRLQLVINTEKAVTIMDTMARWSNEHLCTNPKNGEADLYLPTGQVLFMGCMLSYTEGLREYDIDYGILPVPMFDENQGAYYVTDCSGPFCVPTTIRNPDMVGATLELLAFYSGAEGGVKDTYYDIVLDGQLSQDPETTEMLDIIFDGMFYDPAICYFGFQSGIFNLFYAPHFEAREKGNSNFASLFAENEVSANKVLDDFYRSLEVMEEMNQYLN